MLQKKKNVYRQETLPFKLNISQNNSKKPCIQYILKSGLPTGQGLVEELSSSPDKELPNIDQSPEI